MGNGESDTYKKGKRRTKRSTHSSQRSTQSSPVGNYKPPRLGPQAKTAARERAIDRYSLDSKKPRKPKGNLQRKEQILAVLDDADNLKDKKKTTYHDDRSGKSFHSLTSMNEYRFKEYGIPIPNVPESSLECPSGIQTSSRTDEFKWSAVSSSTKEGNAAISRMQAGGRSKRRMKTADMVLTEGLNKSEETPIENTGASSRRKKKNTDD